MTPLVDAQMLVDALPTAAFVLDVHDVVVAANGTAVKTCAHDTTAAVGKNLKDFLGDVWRPALTRAVADMKREHRTQLVSVAPDTSNADRPAWGVRVQPIHDDNGSLNGVLVTADDDRESERLCSATLEAANAERNRFLAMLAHELRNPLAGITNALYLLRRRHVGQGDRLAEQALRVAHRQAQNQARLLNDLLDVSRIVLGKIVLRVEPTDLVAVARQAIEVAEFELRSRAHTLRSDVPDDPVRVMGDRVRLEQVVANLLGNAVKYTPAGGEIGLTITASSEAATLTVTDTGVGIERELLDRIFDLFTQGDASRARAAGGLGVGLTVARHLVTLHGGTIEAHSAGRGQGTTFTVSLPLTSEMVAPEPEPSARAAPRPRRILVVDDNRDARDMLRTILELDGHHVQDAADGAHAVRLAVEWAPDVAIIDIGLPEIDGYEVALRIRKRVGDAVRLIALTGYGDAEARELAVKSGFEQHLVKPIDPDRLADLIRAL